jgi:hypothetical protein
MADTKPTRVEYVFGGRCKGIATEMDPTVEAILRELGAQEVYGIQGKLTVTIENDITGEDEGGAGAA